LIFTATKTPTHQIIIRPNQNIHFKDIGTSDQSSVAQSSSKISPSILAIQMKICRFMASTKKIFNKIISVPSININLTNKRNETVAMEYLDRNDSLDNMIFYLEKFLEKGADLDIKDINGRNYYEIISYNLSISRNNDRLQTLNKFEKYLMTESSLAQNKLSFRENENEINKDFKLYLRKWDFKTKKQKYNLSR